MLATTETKTISIANNKKDQYSTCLHEIKTSAWSKSNDIESVNLEDCQDLRALTWERASVKKAIFRKATHLLKHGSLAPELVFRIILTAAALEATAWGTGLNRETRVWSFAS